MPSLLLLRHTPLAGADGLCYGRHDLALAPDSATQIATAVSSLPAIGRLISSPSSRCQQLARAVSSATGVAPEIDPRWQEMHFGAWEGLRWDDVPRPQLDAWAQDTWSRSAGGGETAAQLYARVREALDELRHWQPMPAASAATRPARIAVVSHAGPIRAARVILEGLDYGQHFSMQADYGQWVEYELG